MIGRIKYAATCVIPDDRHLRLLALATFINTIGTGAFLSAGAVFLVRSVGLAPPEIGVGLTTGALLGFSFGPLLGDLADRKGGREVMCACLLVQAVGSAGLLLVRDVQSLAIVAAVAAIGRAGTGSARGSIIGVLAATTNGARIRTYLRAVTNVGLALGTVGSTAVMAIDTRASYVAMVLTDVSTFLLAGLVLSRLPHLAPSRGPMDSEAHTPADQARRWLAFRDLRYQCLALATAIAGLQYQVLVLALPIWVTERTEAPRWMAGALFLLAAVVVSAVQVPATRSVRNPRSAARLIALSGPLFCAAWALVAWASGRPSAVAVVMLVVGVLAHSLAEVWQAAGTFELSFALADDTAHGQYQGVFGIAHNLVDALAPFVVITLCVTGGKFGWMVLAGIVAAAGLASALVERVPARVWRLRARDVSTHGSG